MIQLTCTSCQQLLTIDDAFAGGVCRCQHCGTIQTVPAHLKGGKVAASSAKAPKTLFQTRGGASTATGSSLDELGDIVASSGLAGSGLSTTTRRATRAPAKEKAGPSPSALLKLIIVGGVIMIVLLTIVIVLLLMRGGSNPPTASTPPAAAPPSQASAQPVQGAAPSGELAPNYCGIPITDDRVVILIDNGSGTHDAFGDLINATAKSLQSFGANRSFSIMFWNPEDSPAYPAADYAPADEDHIEAAKTAMSNVNPYGATEVTAQLTRALTLSPGTVVIVTGKGWELDKTFAAAAEKAIGGSSVKIDALNIGSQGGSDGLQALTKKTGGIYKDISTTDLSQMGQ